MKICILTMALGVLVASGCKNMEARTNRADESVAISNGTMDTVVAAARQAVPGLEVQGVERDDEHGVETYDVTGMANGERYEVEVTAAGKVREIEKGPEANDDDEDGDDDGEDDDQD